MKLSVPSATRVDCIEQIHQPLVQIFVSSRSDDSYILLQHADPKYEMGVIPPICDIPLGLTNILPIGNRR